jgi:hypothetical protein
MKNEERTVFDDEYTKREKTFLCSVLVIFSETWVLRLLGL